MNYKIPLLLLTFGRACSRSEVLMRASRFARSIAAFTFLFFLPLGGVGGGSLHAQDADKLYKEGKALYDKKAYKEAVPKLQAAANKGHKKAQYRLGRCYDKGNGVAEDEAKAFAWYSKSAAQNYHKAQYQLGRCYKKGKGVAKDHKKAVRYFLLAARQDNADAQLALAKCYLKGKGIEKDQKKAKMWVTKAVKNEEDGAEILAELRKDAAEGDEDAKILLTLAGKK